MHAYVTYKCVSNSNKKSFLNRLSLNLGPVEGVERVGEEQSSVVHEGGLRLEKENTGMREK